MTAASGDDLHRAVDDVLEAAWPSERRRASRRLLVSALVRIALGTACLWALILAIGLGLGTAPSWPFLLFVAGLTAAAGLHGARHPDHLRRDGVGPDRTHPRPYRPWYGTE